MAKKYAGIYLYYDWIDALSGIPAAKAMKIIKNLRGYAEHGVEPAPMDGTPGYLQGLFLGQLKRARINAENGKLGGAPSHKKPSATKENDGERRLPGLMSEEELAAVAFTDYLRLSARFHSEAEATEAADGSRPRSEESDGALPF
jgi:hypothetical protein